jgi:hypothetical protein
MFKSRQSADIAGLPRSAPSGLLKKMTHAAAALMGTCLVFASLSSQATTLQDQPVTTLGFDNFRTVSDGTSYNYSGFSWGSKWNGSTQFNGNALIHLDNDSGHTTLISRTDGSDFIFDGVSFGWGSIDRNGAKVSVVLYGSTGQTLWQSDRENLTANGFFSFASGYSGAVKSMAIGLQLNDPANTSKLQMDNFAYRALPVAAPVAVPVSPSPVPEPTTEAMMAIGLLALASTRRGARSKKAARGNQSA